MVVAKKLVPERFGRCGSAWAFCWVHLKLDPYLFRSCWVICLELRLNFQEIIKSDAVRQPISYCDYRLCDWGT